MDLNWFLTIPGMLITGGVLLLIIALVIFIATSNKKGKEGSKTSKKSEEGAKAMVAETAQNGVNPLPASDNMVGGVPPVNNVVGQEQPLGGDLGQNIAVPTNPEVAVSPVESGVPTPADTVPISADAVANFDVPLINSNAETTTPPISDLQSTMPTSTPVMPEAPTDAMKTPEIAPLQADTAPVIGVDNNVVAQTTPTIEPAAVEAVTPVGTPEVITPEQTPITPSVTPIEQTPEVVPTPQEVAPVAPVTTPEQTSAQTPSPIYGGASPTVSDINVNNQNHEIYGGANPLENTQTISINDINQQATTMPANNQATQTPMEQNPAPVADIPVVAAAPTVTPAVTPAPATGTPQEVTPAVVASPVAPAPNQVQ